MLHWIYQAFGPAWGPLRLFDSFFFLAGAGFAFAALSTWILLPRLWKHLPVDRGRAHAVNAELSIGKPLSCGVVFVSIFALACLIFLPIDAVPLRTVPLILAA